MTKKELYNAVKNGREFGEVCKSGLWRSLWRSGDYIYFRHYGQFACRCNYKDFASDFNIAFADMTNFLKHNQEIIY